MKLKTPTKKSPGRPRTGVPLKKNRVICLTDRVWRELGDLAADQGLSNSAWVSQMVLAELLRKDRSE